MGGGMGGGWEGSGDNATPAMYGKSAKVRIRSGVHFNSTEGTGTGMGTGGTGTGTGVNEGTFTTDTMDGMVDDNPKTPVNLAARMIGINRAKVRDTLLMYRLCVYVFVIILILFLLVYLNFILCICYCFYFIFARIFTYFPLNIH
jgi:hypothetical protein